MSTPADRARIDRGRAALVVACLLLALLQIAAFRWGVVTPDTVVQYGQALSGHYDDWHPPVTAWLWRQLLHLGTGGAPFLLFDVLLYWGAVWLIADVLRVRFGGWSAALPILLAILPIPFGQVGAILKDPLMACLMLMAAALLVRRWVGGPWWLALVALVLIVVAAATRFNALFAALPLLLLAAPRAWTARPMGFVATATAAVLLLGTSNWAINEAMLRPSHSHPLYSLINFDLAGIVAHGGTNGYPDLGDADARRITAHCYDARMYGAHDDAGCEPAEDSIADHVARTGDSPVGIWLNAVLVSPRAYVAHRLAHLNWNWRFAVPAVPDDAAYMMSEPNDLGLHFRATRLTHLVGDAARVMAWTPFGRPATWLALALGLLIVAPRLASARVVVALACSALLYGGGYAAVSVAPDLRYNLWTLLAVSVGLALALAERGVSRRRWAVALIPAMLVILAEVAALGL